MEWRSQVSWWTNRRTEIPAFPPVARSAKPVAEFTPQIGDWPARPVSAPNHSIVSSWKRTDHCKNCIWSVFVAAILPAAMTNDGFRRLHRQVVCYHLIWISTKPNIKWSITSDIIEILKRGLLWEPRLFKFHICVLEFKCRHTHWKYRIVPVSSRSR